MGLSSGPYIKVKVFPKSKRAEVVEIGEGAFHVYVKSDAKGGAANREMIDLLASHLGCGPRKLVVMSGARRPNKIIKVLGE